MTTYEELNKILANPEIENNKIELKRKSVLKEANDLAGGLVALANRHGGKFIIGIKNNGEFEGKDIFDIDKAKNIIDNICHDRCSPPIDYFIEFLKCNEGDVIIVNVERRKGIPHAYTMESKGEIENRVYYVRTSHGKRLVTDTQLDWMFRSVTEPGFSNTFTFQMPYDRLTFRPVNWEGIPWQGVYWDFIFLNIFQNFSVEDIAFLQDNEPSKISQLFLEIMPLITLSGLSMAFSVHWNMMFEKLGDAMIIRTIEDLPKKEYNIRDICTQMEFPILNQTSIDLESIFNNPFQRIYVPEKVEVEIIQQKKEPRELGTLGLKLYKNDEYQIEINFQNFQWRVNPPSSHPIYSILNDTEIFDFQKKYATISLRTDIKSMINVFDYDVSKLNEIKRWMSNINEALEEKLSWERYTSKLPPSMLYRIDYNIKEILKKIQ